MTTESYRLTPTQEEPPEPEASAGASRRGRFDHRCGGDPERWLCGSRAAGEDAPSPAADSPSCC